MASTAQNYATPDKLEMCSIVDTWHDSALSEDQLPLVGDEDTFLLGGFFGRVPAVWVTGLLGKLDPISDVDMDCCDVQREK